MCSVTSWALKKEVEEKYKERTAFVKLLGCIIYFAQKKGTYFNIIPQNLLDITQYLFMGTSVMSAWQN